MILDPPSGLLSSEFQVRRVLEQAGADCARRLGVDRDTVFDLLLHGDRSVHSAFRYALAEGIAGHLGGLGAAFQGVYVYGSAAGESAGPASDIDFIVVVDRRCAEAERIIRLLNLSLSHCYRSVTGFSGPTDLLDVHVVDLDEEHDRRGYGAVLHDPWTAPLCLWRAGTSASRRDRMPQPLVSPR